MLLLTTTFVTLECGVCGCPHAISTDRYNKALSTGEYWYCPNGHHIHFCKTENEKLRDQVNRLEQQKINLHSLIEVKDQRINQLQYSVRAQKAAKTKILHRIKHGVCPCCNRTFKNLQGHFKVKHPELFKSKPI